MIIAVDFDGTVVTHDYPEIGTDIPNAEDVLKRLVKQGHQLILYTMRSGEHLEQAVQWFAERSIELWGINENPDQHEWTESRKVYAQIYIDDAALGCPLEKLNHPRHQVDWFAVEQKLMSMGMIPVPV